MQAYLFLVLLFVTVNLFVDASYNSGHFSTPVEAQRIDPLSRVVNRSSTSTIRSLSRGAKGEMGEAYMDIAIRQLYREFRDIDLYLNKNTYTRGIDGLFFSARRQRYIVSEAKATSSTGMLYEGLLGTSAVGRQMDTPWIRRSLSNAESTANTILQSPTATAAQRQAANRILRNVQDINQRSLRRTDRTLVVTRLAGLDGQSGVGHSIHVNLAQHFDNIIEVDPRKRVINSYPGKRSN